MENLLASIRQAIDNDLGSARAQPRAPTVASIKTAMEDLRAKAGTALAARSAEVSSEINELRNKINRNRGAPLPLSDPKTPFAQIMAGQVKMPEKPALPAPQSVTPQQALPPPEPAPPAYEQPSFPSGQEGWQTESYAHQDYGYQDDGQLLSQESAYAAQSSFNELAQAIMHRALGERSIEDLTQELLKTMLRNWLDVNLPSLVERLVREEIERVARRGR